MRKNEEKGMQKIQGLVGVRLSGFESPLRHQQNQGVNRMPVNPFFSSLAYVHTAPAIVP
jgi:hypothetical protein